MKILENWNIYISLILILVAVFVLIVHYRKHEKPKIIKRVELMEGMVVKMLPTTQSHERLPYYAKIIYYNAHAKKGEVIVTTSIPGRHKLDMIVGENWEYHKSRMIPCGMWHEKPYTTALHTYEDLLHNQPFMSKIK